MAWADFNVEGLMTVLPTCWMSSIFQNSSLTPAVMITFWGALVNELQKSNISLVTSVFLSDSPYVTARLALGGSFVYFVFGILLKSINTIQFLVKIGEKPHNSNIYERTVSRSDYYLQLKQTILCEERPEFAETFYINILIENCRI
jgi:hypothetical protein